MVKAQPIPTDDEFYESLRIFIDAAVIAQEKDRRLYGEAYRKAAAQVPRMGEAEPREREE